MHDFLFSHSCCLLLVAHCSCIGRLGVCARYFTLVGNDSLGDYFVSAMRDAGVVDTQQTITRVTQEPTPCCVVLSSLATATSSADRCFVNSFGTNRAVTAEHFLKHWDIIRERSLPSTTDSKSSGSRNSNRQTNHIHIAGYFNCSKLQTQPLVQLCERARAARITISLDTQTDSLTDRWRGQEDNLLHMLPLLDYFMPSDVEAMAIANKTTTVDNGILKLDCYRVGER